MTRSADPHPPVPVIGITGPIGAGKSLVAALFAEWGGIVISGDRIGHEVVERSPHLRRRLVRAFGADAVRGGTVDRAVLGERAFRDRESLRCLNALVHPPLLRLLNQRIRAARARKDAVAVVVDATLLPEWGHTAVPWDALVGVWAPRRLRWARLKRRCWSEAQIRARSRGQLAWARRRVFCDIVVKNDSSRRELRRRARECWNEVLSLLSVRVGSRTARPARRRKVG